jgi:DNA-binding transcriptional MerR regulator
MRISELGRQSGVPVATIKFYLREGLLPPGTPTARNQAEYDETHLARLRLMTILTGVGKLSLSSVREVLSAIDDKGLSVRGQCQVINRALFADRPGRAEIGESARVSVDEFIDRLGWQVDRNSPGRGTLAHVLSALRRLGWDCDVEVFAPYADAAERVAAHEQECLPGDPAATLVARTVLFEVALAALRRMAHEHYLGPPADAGSPALP